MYSKLHKVYSLISFSCVCVCVHTPLKLSLWVVILRVNNIVVGIENSFLFIASGIPLFGYSSLLIHSSIDTPLASSQVGLF